MSVFDESREMLVKHMNSALQRVTDALDAQEALNCIPGSYADRDDWDGLDEGTQDLLEDLGIEPDEEGDWDHTEAAFRVREDLDPLAVTWEKGEPFDVALTLGGPNIYLVDMGGHGGAQLVGHWSVKHVITGPDVSRALDYYREEMSEIFGD